MKVGQHAATRAIESEAQEYEYRMSFKRALFQHGIVRWAWEWLASIDHGLQTVPRVLAARRSASLVVADRYYPDSLVDMGANFGSTPPAPRGLFRLFPKPDHVIVLDAPERVAFSRKDDVPSIEYLEQRRSLYLELARREGWRVVDASRTAEEVHAEIANAVWSSGSCR